MSAGNLTAEPIVIVRLEQPRCALSHAQLPCQASGVPCYNTFSTCQDRENYTAGPTLDLYFGLPGQSPPADELQILPFLARWPTTTAARVNLSGSDRRVNPLGIRASADIRFLDSGHDDQLVDPYRDQRGGDPERTGSFWGKWFARNTFGRLKMRVSIFEGFAGEPLSQMTHRLYFADEFDFTGEEIVTLKCRDLFAQAAESTAPVVSPGELAEDLSETATTLRLAQATLEDYPASGTLRINEECLTYSGISLAPDGFLDVTITARGTDGTEVEEHEAEDQVQECFRLDNLTPDEALSALYAFTPVPAIYLPSDDWRAEAGEFLSSYRLNGLVTEPEPVDRLLGRVLEMVQGIHWWDEQSQTAPFQAIKPLIDVPTLLTEGENILAGSISVRDYPDRRVSRVYVYYGLRNATEDWDEPENYRRVQAELDLSLEDDNAFGAPATRRLFAPFIDSTAVAFETASRILRRYREGARELTFAVSERDGNDLPVGRIVRVRWFRVQNTEGLPDTRLWIITSRKADRARRRVIYTAEDATLAGVIVRIAENSVGDYVGDGSDPFGVAWISDNDGFLPNGDPGFTIE